MESITIDLYRSGKWNPAWHAWHTEVYGAQEAHKTIELCKGAPDACRVEVTYHPQETHVIFEKKDGLWTEQKEGEQAE